MKTKTELLESMSNELNDFIEQFKESNEHKRKIHTVAMIIDYVSRNCDEESTIIKKLAESSTSLNELYEVFTKSIDTDKVFEKVFKDFFDGDQSSKTDVKVYCDELEDEDYQESFEEDDEGFIHDNEDC